LHFNALLCLKLLKKRIGIPKDEANNNEGRNDEDPSVKISVKTVGHSSGVKAMVI
jgi:hypothetical protein